MFSKDEEIRYSRHFRLEGFGEESQRRLKNSSVLVIGAGGLGCPALQYLSAAGIGTIGIMDGDVVSLSNLQRQILYSESDIGQNKAEVAASKLSHQNPNVNFDINTEYLTSHNALDVLDHYDVIVDGSDNFETRYLVNDACVILEKPFVYGAILKFEGQVSVFNFQGGPTYRCLFNEPPKGDLIPNCAEVGVIGVLPGIIGSYQANEAIKILAGIGETLSGKLLLFDALKMSHFTVGIKPVPENKQIADLSRYEIECGSPIPEVSIRDFQMHQDIIDVREHQEFSEFNIGGINIPLGSLQSGFKDLSVSKEYVIVCKSGIRSRKAIEVLRELGFSKLSSLKGGLDAYLEMNSDGR